MFRNDEHMINHDEVKSWVLHMGICAKMPDK